MTSSSMLRPCTLSAASSRAAARPFTHIRGPATHLQRQFAANTKSGSSWGRGEENAAEVRRLIGRDRKEFLGNEEDILDKYKTEFGNNMNMSTLPPPPQELTSSTPNPFESRSAPAAPSSPASSSDNSFKSPAPAPASPFGAAPVKAPFKSAIEPKGLTPEMGPDPISREKPLGILQSITLTQIVLFCSFTLIILLMLATFNVVLGTGAIRIAGLD